MPELPDILAYVAALNREFQDRPLRRIDVRSPFVLRTVEPPIAAVDGQRVTDVRRLGKQLVWTLENGLLIVVHLMIAGRFHKRKPRTQPRGKNDLAAFQFDEATLMLTEASPKKRAALHLLAGEEELSAFDRAALDVTNCTFERFAKRLQAQNHTVKRALTDPRILDGIGNASNRNATTGASCKCSEIGEATRRCRLFVASRYGSAAVSPIQMQRVCGPCWAGWLISKFG